MGYNPPPPLGTGITRGRIPQRHCRKFHRYQQYPGNINPVQQLYGIIFDEALGWVYLYSHKPLPRSGVVSLQEEWPQYFLVPEDDCGGVIYHQIGQGPPEGHLLAVPEGLEV